ncbi:hypothetical protein GCM10023339_26060 [Alloalcanivorax gelatiniphagus]
MRVLRDWTAWAAAWVLAVEAPVWVAVALDAWHERTDPTLEPMPVASWVSAPAYVAGVAVPLGLLLAVVGLRVAVVRRIGFAVGAFGLAVGAVTFTGFPEGVVGPWTVGLTGLAAGLALVVALLPAADGSIPSTSSAARPSAALPGAALTAAGLFTAWTCWRGGSYWDWRGASARSYQLGVAAAAVMVGLGLTATRWSAVGSRVLRWLLLALGVLGALWAAAGASYLLDGGALFRWEEDESPWDFGVPFLLLGTGLAAAAVAAWRRRGDLVSWSVASAASFSLLALWQQSTWGSVMR